MFEDSLIESGGKLKTARGKTTTFSFVLEAVIVGILVLIPLLFTEALPKAQLMMALVAPPPPPPPPPPPAAVKIVKQVQTDIVNGQLRTPTKIPKKVEIIKEEEAPPPMSGVVGGVPGGVPGGQMNGVIGGIISNAPMAVPKVAVQRVRVSQGVTQGMVLHKVQPTYPPLARTARVQGSVLLAAVIGKDGTIQNLHVISGHPLLTQAALEAVRQWRYRPYILNGEPVEVDTQVTVNFTLSGG
ncbi:MAG: energy transducer TonB [Acidobacteria bacterium]|nr:MAG: energy transducer TonB [Acidobacteriota bacterium]